MKCRSFTRYEAWDIALVRSAFDPHTLRGRLTLAYTGALLIALCAYATGALITLRQMEQITLDRQLTTSAAAVRAIVEEKGASITLEDTDAKQFYAILGLRLNGTVLDASGNTVISNIARPPYALTSVPADGPIPTKIRFMTLGTGDDRIRAIVTPIISQGRKLGTVILWSPIEWFADLEIWVLRVGIFTLAIIVAPATAMGAFIARRELKPLAYITEVASEIAANDLTRRLSIMQGTTDELRRLSAAFNRMLDRLQASFERERRFTADASHELRAPLAVIVAETDLALRRERGADVYRSTLLTIATVSKELETLIDDLLSAARAEIQPEESLRPIDLDTVVLAAVERLRPLADIRQISIRESPGCGTSVLAEPSELKQAITAVLHNALRYAPIRGEVQANVLRHEDAALIQILDDGPGFTAEGLTHALERFWRADPARSPGSGSGLGLAGARATVERLGGHIELANREHGGAEVRIRLPLADTPGACRNSTACGKPVDKC
jgi:two-component system OmpR family sensor kinase